MTRNVRASRLFVKWIIILALLIEVNVTSTDGTECGLTVLPSLLAVLPIEGFRHLQQRNGDDGGGTVRNSIRPVPIERHADEFIVRSVARCPKAISLGRPQAMPLDVSGALISAASFEDSQYVGAQRNSDEPAVQFRRETLS